MERVLGRRPGQQGMSLMEVMVALALLVAMVGLATPYMSALMGIEVREAANKLGSTVQYLFDQAAISGRTYRVAFNLDRHAWWVEAAAEGREAMIYQSPQAREDGEKATLDLVAELAKERERALGAAAVQTAPLADSILASFERVDDELVKAQALPDTVYLAGVWTPQYEDVLRPSDTPPEDETKDHIAYVHLFPGGYAERAYIYLSDGGEDWYTLVVEPLTGRVTVFNEEIEVPRELRAR